MADNTALAKDLAGSMAGMSPEQALQTANMNVGAMQTQQQLQQQQQQFDTQTKMKLINQAIDQRFQQKKMELETRRVDAYDRMAKAQELNAGAAYQKAQREYQALEQQQRYAETVSQLEFNTQWGPMKGSAVLAATKMGIPIKVQEGDKVIEVFEKENEDGTTTVKALAVIDGVLQTTSEFEGIAGYSKMVDKETQIQMGPGERAEESKEGSLRGEVTGQKWKNDFYEGLFATDEKLWSRINHSDPSVRAYAKTQARQEAARQLSSYVGGKKVVFGEYDGKIGFWYEQDDGTVKNIRGDI